MANNKGANFPKNPDSTCVINLMLPRDISEPIQKIRTQYIPDARCGPHFSFLDPFVKIQYYQQAAKLLKQALSNFPPFQMKLSKLNYFVHKQSCTVYLDPETQPPNAIQDLLDICLKVFPQCDDQIKKSKDSKYVPHMSIAKFASEEEVKKNLDLLQNQIPQTSFTIDALFLLHRKGPDPFECIHEVVFQNLTLSPRYGVGSPGDSGTPGEEDQVGRSLVVAGFSKGQSNDWLLQVFEDQKIEDIERVEVTLNPNGSTRNCGVVQFKSHQAALNALNRFKAPATDPGMYVKFMWLMMAPGPIGSSWSLLTVKPQHHGHFSPNKRKKQPAPLFTN